ncbi:universal stress protein [Parasphingorhabdus halotolerans]|uniref:Universal stress protein n=1 Tax=Parasphingorhabdus halotolerans TaxID=2725558 RepID=A0A6H2DQV3_9SPHN|nr:universal stress protein [Parasphingorhabdus halotolerans]QJB70507.1 universal stress protein [Parasphingorhabdus halotolerans]
MKSVLLYINDDTGLDARLQAALDLTRAVDGHLHCLRSNPYSPQMAFDGVTGMSVMYDVAKMTQEADLALRQEIEQRLSSEDVSWNYREENADSARGLAKNSALTDIIVLSSASGDKDNNIPIGILGDVLFNTRIPVLVQPDSVKKFDATGTALIAWNGSFEAGNALRASVPLLKLAKDVHILTVDEDKDHDLPPLDASEYLSRHGIKSEVHQQTGKKSSAQTALLASIDGLKASYMVMGAYGHSRAREFLFGGVTRSLFRDCPVPLVVSH